MSAQATLITLGVQVYEIMRPKFPHIIEIMQQIPNTNVADIQKLDEKILVGAQSKGKIDKYKKDLFKKVTAQVSTYLSEQKKKKKYKIAHVSLKS